MDVGEAVSRTDEIETGSDIAFEKRWWRLQQVSWGVLLLLIGGGVAGIFGSGPLGKKTVPVQGCKVEYESLARRETPALLTLHLDRQALASGKARVQLSGECMARLRIKDILPKPARTEPVGDGAIFTFPTEADADSATVVFIQDPSRPGLITGQLDIEGVGSVELRQFIYP